MRAAADRLESSATAATPFGLRRAIPADSVALRQIVLGSVLLRVIWALLQGNEVANLPGIADQESYHTLALRVGEGHGFSFESAWWPATAAGQPTAHWSYLYVAVLVAVYALFGPAPLVFRLLQGIAVGVLQPLLTYRIAERMFGRRVALVSAAVVAGYAYFVYYAGALMTESLYLVAILWSIDVTQRVTRSLSRRREATLWLELGLALSVAVLLRQVMLLMVPLLLGWIVWQRARIARSRSDDVYPQASWQRGVLVTTAVIALAMAPWTIRNYRSFGTFVPLNTNAGFAFYWGNHPVHGTRFVPILPGDGSAYGRLIPSDLRGLNEAELDRALLRRGFEFVVNDPIRYVRLSMSRITEYVRFWPTADGGFVGNLARASSFGFCLPLFAIGIVLASRRRRRTAPDSPDCDPLLPLAFVAAYSLIHLLTWTLIRYRLPVDSLLVPFAALAMVWLRDALFTRPLITWSGRQA